MSTELEEEASKRNIALKKAYFYSYNKMYICIQFNLFTFNVTLKIERVCERSVCIVF